MIRLFFNSIAFEIVISEYDILLHKIISVAPYIEKASEIYSGSVSPTVAPYLEKATEIYSESFQPYVDSAMASVQPYVEPYFKSVHAE